MRPVLAILLFSVLSLSWQLADGQTVTGAGDPALMIHKMGFDEYLDHTPALAISSTGTIFALAIREFDPGSGNTEIFILRSTDHGDSWTEWGTLGDPTSGDRILYLRAQVVSGSTFEFLIVSYWVQGPPDELWVCRTDAQAATPAWNREVVESVPRVGGVFPKLGSMALATRPSTTGPATVAVAYFVWTDIDDYELHYSVSLDAAITFQPPVTVVNPGAPASGTIVAYLGLGLGQGGAAHLAIMRVNYDDVAPYSRINYVSAVNDGMVLADWNLPVMHLVDVPVNDYRSLSLACDPLGDDIVIGFNSDSAGGIGLVGSLDGGLTWSPGVIESPETYYQWRLVWSGVGPVAAANAPFGHYLLRPDSGPLGTYEAALFIRTEGATALPAQLATDPSQGEAMTMLAVMGYEWHGIEGLWFNAAWRTSAGYGVLEPGGMTTLGDSDWRFAASPAVTDLDGDGLAEVIVADSQDTLHVYAGGVGADLSVAIGPVGASAVPVVRDLGNDGHPELLVGGADGLLHAFHHDLTPVLGEPFDLGSGAEVFVSAGPVTGQVAGEIVAASGNAVHLMNAAGVPRPGWPRTVPGGTAVGRAAIGDVDADGEVELVAAFTTGIAVLDELAVVEHFLLGSAAAPSSGVTLADLDADGDLEIAAPMSDGTVELIHHDGAVFGASWPFDTATGSPVLGVTVAALMDAASPALCFGTASGGVWAVEPDGSLLPNHPLAVAAGDTLASEPIIDRVARPDTDRPQLIVGTTGGWTHEWSVIGQTPVDWPHYYDVGALSPVVADTDGDGIQELVLTTGSIIQILDTGVTPLIGDQRSWPMTGHDLSRSGCSDCLPAIPAGVPGDGSRGNAAGSPVIRFAGSSPNPAAGRTTFGLALAAPDHVSLSIYDIRGHLVRSVVDRTLPSGEHRLDWDGRDGRGHDVASGVYVARLIFGAGPVRRVMTRELVVQR